MKFNHIGIPTTNTFEGEIRLPRLEMTVSDHPAVEVFHVNVPRDALASLASDHRTPVVDVRV